MIKVEFFGLYRLNYGMAEWETDAKDINDLLKKLHAFNPFYTVKELKNSIILVNGKNFMDLKKYRTKLNPGDEVFIMSPASGG